MSILVGTVADALSGGRRRCFDDGPFHGAADYLFGTGPGEGPSPQALIVRQAPGWSLPVHFHMQYQFQVVLRGGGTLGKHSLVPGTVHYTSPQSAYGPIVAGDGGLDFFTLRVLSDEGARYMPEARPLMQLGMFKEQRWGELSAPQAPFLTLIPTREDGLAACAYRPSPHQTIQCALPPSQAGRFFLVISGSFCMGNIALAHGSCVYCSPDESPRFTASARDSMLIVVQFPHHAACLPEREVLVRGDLRATRVERKEDIPGV